jgi:AcrR family transcriptional regulator
MSVVVRGKRGHVRPDSINVMRGQDTRRRILEAARRRILGEGFEALRLNDLATDAGVTKAAIIKSVGGKASILLALGEQDRATRLEVLQHALTLKSGLRRRLTDVLGRLFELDVPRIKLVQAYIGYLWFWADEDHNRAQTHVDGTLEVLRDLMRSAARPAETPDRARILALRLMAGYVIGLRDLYYRRSDVEEATRLVLDFTFA